MKSHESRIFSLKNPNYHYSFKTRESKSYQVNNSMASKFAENLNRVKGKLEESLTQSGQLEIQQYINFKIDRKSKKMPNLNLFKEEIESRGLNVIFLADSSLSMTYAYNNLRNISATIFKALEKCPFINFEVISYSGLGGGQYSDHHVKLQEIKKLEDCKYISADHSDRLTPTDLSLEYAWQKIRKLEGKKLVILFTDGYPEDSVYDMNEMYDKVKKQIVKMQNDKINFFTIYFQNYTYCGKSEVDNQITPYMRKLFKNTMYQSSDFKQIEKIIHKNLIKSIERLNQN